MAAINEMHQRAMDMGANAIVGAKLVDRRHICEDIVADVFNVFFNNNGVDIRSARKRTAVRIL